MEKGKFIYEGKAKQLYETDDKDLVIVHYKDDATAGNGAKKGTIHNKGIMNNEITALIFNMLEEHGIKTHFVKKLNDRDQLCQRVKIFPLEVIVRNIIAGSMAKRVGIKEGTKINNTEKFDNIGITLVDFKIEFGKNSKGEILLADEITPDTCRLWDKETGEKLDKDRFRRDLGNIEEAYIEVVKRLTEKK